MKYDVITYTPYEGLNYTICRAGLKGGQWGQLPRAPRFKGAPRDEIYLFQIKYSFEKFS